MSTDDKVTNERTRQVETHFKDHGFKDTVCYQRNGYDFLMRLRIIDGRFDGLSRSEREDIIEPLIGQLDEELQADITMLVLLAPGEERESLANHEFESPSPSFL